MGIGAVFGAMNTMYAIVSQRTREIGTLRALGFSRLSILVSFVMESVLLAMIGGALGCLLAFTMNGYTAGTGQTQSFSEMAFAFKITPPVLIFGMVFAVMMGFVGGLLPAFRASTDGDHPGAARSVETAEKSAFSRFVSGRDLTGCSNPRVTLVLYQGRLQRADRRFVLAEPRRTSVR